MDHPIPWSRVVMNREIDRLVHNRASKFDKLNMLEISGNRWQVSGEKGNHTIMQYPDHDICENKLDEKFNLIIAEMVFEHLPYPYRAGKNVFEMLDTPGCFVISVPFMYPVHNYPIDCTRWTAIGLKYFLTECGFEFNNIYADSWGNGDFVKEQGNSLILYDEKKHSLRNDPRMPVSVWGLADK
jgi:hypothetical protein